MSHKDSEERLSNPLSRREFLAATGAGLATAAAAEAETDSASGAAANSPAAPFDSIRDYIEALESRGLVMRFDRIDQDAYEGTALMYRLVDRYDRFHAPVVVFDQVRINGQWMSGPIVANLARHVNIEAILFGVEPVPGDTPATYHAARAHLDALLKKNDGAYPDIPPKEISRDKAPCKEVTLNGDEIDIESFPFFKNNPGDSGRFINTATVFTSDPEMGLNIGTYRCEIKGPRHIALGTGEGQTGFNMLVAAKQRGEKTAPVTLVVGHDPIIWLMSGSRIPARRGKEPVNELATAGGLRGKAVDVVRGDTNEFLVPAHAEMIIEGTVSLEGWEPNGPYGEGSGYIGAPYEKAFTMTVDRVTHRRDPWFTNDFTGVTRPLMEMPAAALTTAGLQKFIPEVRDYRYQDSVVFLSIEKKEPGQALAVGKQLIEMIPVFKIVMMVDADVDLWNTQDLFMAFATRWQAFPASHIYEDMPSMPLEPSSPRREHSSKIVIDATRQWPEEGGPEHYPEYSRAVLARHDPEIFARVDAKWGPVISRSGKA